MPNKTRTTIVLSDKFHSLKNKLASVYGLKNVVSAGLLLFNRLSALEQKKIIHSVHEMGNEPAKKKTTKK